MTTMPMYACCCWCTTPSRPSWTAASCSPSRRVRYAAANPCCCTAAMHSLPLRCCLHSRSTHLHAHGNTHCVPSFTACPVLPLQASTDAPSHPCSPSSTTDKPCTICPPPPDAGPVLPLKDPTSDMAVIARQGSKLVKVRLSALSTSYGAVHCARAANLSSCVAALGLEHGNRHLQGCGPRHGSKL